MEEDRPRWWKRRPWKELLTALVGAAITSIVQLLFSLRSGEGFEWISFLLAAITGGIIGWGYQLANGLREVSNQALARLEVATQALEVQEEPLKMLRSARFKEHPKTALRLLSDSLKKYRSISYVDDNEYLGYLISAISESQKYEGIQRFPVSWFERSDRGTRYLRQLRDQKKMKEKTRIFIIDEQHVEDMKADLDNTELMESYWANTGTEVKTYWITVPQLSEHFQNQVSIPRDFALYDDKLLIEYNETLQTLSFDIIESDDDWRLEVFRRLAIQEEHDMDEPFTKIEPRQA